MKFTDLGDKGPQFKLQDMTEEFVDEASLAQMRDYFAGKMSLTDEPAKSKPGEFARMRDHFSKEKPMAGRGTAPNLITDKMPPDIVMILHAINKGTAITKAQFNRLHSYKMYGESVEDVAEGNLKEFAPGAGDEGGGEDPYKYPKPESYRRSADFFGQFEADHFDREDMNDATGEFKGYWGKDQIAYFKFNNPAKTGSDDPGMGWYYEPQSNNGNDAKATPAVDTSAQRKQQELSMISAFLKSGQTPKPGSQIHALMKKQGMAEGNLKEFAPGGGGGESGRWYTDDQITDIVGDGWYNDLDVSGDIPKQQMIQEAQAWLDDQGYNVQVLNCKVNDDDMEWYIEGSFQNSGFAKKGVAEGFNGEYDDEAGMAKSNLRTMARAVNGLIDTIGDDENLPEWAQEKIAKAEMMVTGVWDYLLSQEEQGIDPKVDEASLASMRDYFSQADSNTVAVDNQYGAPERKQPANVPPEIQLIINKMYRVGKITPQELDILKRFQAKTGINVGLKIKEAGILFASTQDE